MPDAVEAAGANQGADQQAERVSTGGEESEPWVLTPTLPPGPVGRAWPVSPPAAGSRLPRSARPARARPSLALDRLLVAVPSSVTRQPPGRPAPLRLHLAPDSLPLPVLSGLSRLDLGSPARVRPLPGRDPSLVAVPPSATRRVPGRPGRARLLPARARLPAPDRRASTPSLSHRPRPSPCCRCCTPRSLSAPCARW